MMWQVLHLPLEAKKVKALPDFKMITILLEADFVKALLPMEGVEETCIMLVAVVVPMVVIH